MAAPLRLIRPFVLLAALATAALLQAQHGHQGHGHDHAHGAAGKVQYVENQGQWPDQVRFKGLVNGAAVFLEEEALTWVKFEEEVYAWMHDSHMLPEAEREAYSWRGHAWRMRFAGAATPTISTAGRATTYHNYFLGNDPAKWAGGVALFDAVTYAGLWPGVNLRMHGEGGNMKYDLLLEPGADPARIALVYEGTDGVVLGRDGQLVVRTSVGEVVEMAPVAFYGDAEGGEVPCRFQVSGNTVSFLFPEGYDADRPLTIDPVLVASTLSGATGNSNYGHCATYDDAGNMYTGARNFGPSYPTTLGAFQTAYSGGGTDISVSKYNPDGSLLIYATYLGGNSGENPHSMIVTRDGELCMLNSTSSANYPVTAGCHDNTLAGTDIAMTRFSADGSALVGSSFVGGTGTDGTNSLGGNYGEAFRGEIFLDAAENMLVASFSSSADFPTTAGAYQTAHGGGQDGVVFAMDRACSNLLYSTYIGGSLGDGAFGLRIAPNGDLLVVGQTASTDFPTTAGSYQPTYQGGTRDGFVVRFAPGGSALLGSTFFGTTGTDRPYFIDTDQNDDVWIYGQTGGPLPIQPAGTFGDPSGTGGLFVAKLTGALDAAPITTKIGTSLTSSVPVAFLVDVCDNVYISGYDSWSGLPVIPDNLYASGDFYLAAFDVDMTAQLFGTYYGGSHVDGGTSRFDKNGIVYQGVCSGFGSMQTTPWAWATNQTISWDIGVFKIDFQVSGVNAAGASALNQGCAPIVIDFSNNSSGDTWIWDFGDGSPPMQAFEPSHTYTQPGSYTVTLIAMDALSCNLADTTYLPVTIGQQQPIDADFTWSQTVDCAELEITTVNLSTGDPLEWFWDMGDGTLYTDTNVTHLFSTPGNYLVQLIASDPTGCSASDTVQVPVTVSDAQLVEADFNLTETPGCGELEVVCTNQSTGVGMSYLWDMGDGTTYTTADVNHLYQGAGTYTISLIATDANTCNGADTLLATVTVDPIPVLTSAFSLTESVVCDVLTLQAVNQSTGTDLIFDWQLSDGSQYADTNITHAFSGAGTYTVTLNVSDLSGCATPQSSSATVQIDPLDPVEADFTWAQTLDCSVLEVSATNLNAGNGNDWLWLMGDGTQYTSTDVVHQYTSPGSYVMQLIASDPSGCVPDDTLQVPLTIGPPPQVTAGFLLAETPGCEELGVACTNQSTGVGMSYLWNMGDGTTYTTADVNHLYQGAGTYTISLIATDANTCNGADTLLATVTVDPIPVLTSAFSLTESVVCDVLTLQAVNQSTGTDLIFDWQLSDGSQYADTNITHAFSGAGTYTVTLNVSDLSGCATPQSSSATVQIDPLDPVEADFTWAQTLDCSVLEVSATNLNAGNGNDWLWLMGDGTQYTSTNVVHQYTSPGSYVMQLIASDPSGCVPDDTLQVPLTIGPPPQVTAGFLLTETPGCEELGVACTNQSTGVGMSYLWDMGDGTTYTTPDVNHLYQGAGTYTISLIATDVNTCNGADTLLATVTVDPIPVLTAGFTATQVFDCNALVVQTVDQSTGTGLVYDWQLSDGSQYSTPEVDHAFSGPGIYTITLTVSDSSGCATPQSVSLDVEVDPLEPVVAAFTAEQVGDCSLLNVSTQNLSTGDSVSYTWDMGDGTLITGTHAAHSYTALGTYTITLTVTDLGCGQDDQLALPVELIDQLPVSVLGSSTLCPDSVTVLNADFQGPLSVLWNTGETTPAITVDLPGTYTVTASDSVCAGSASFTVAEAPRHELFQSVVACPQTWVDLTIPLEGLVYSWATGGTDRSERVFGAGVYTYQVVDLWGCPHTDSVRVEAQDPVPLVFAPNAFTPNGDGINDVFRIVGFGDRTVKLIIFNRWGEQLWADEGTEPSWDGWYQGSLVKNDVYVYKLQYTGSCTNDEHETIGHVTVVR